MNKEYVRLIQGITVLGCLAPVSIQAQIVPDATLPENSVVTQQDNLIQIDGGTTRGSNLFHSFQEFSVPSGVEAFFNNADAISNILSRVTGGNISNIEGSIGAVGTANLFLINPAGIIFGPNSSLNIGGSFLGSTADSILFPDGSEFSATNSQAQSMLTINAPIGLSFRDNPQPITNSSTLFLVPGDQTLALIGGDVSIEGALLGTLGGRIEIGGVAGNNIVSLNPVAKGWDVGYEGVENFRDLNFSGAALVTTLGANTGDIEVQGRNISLTEGSEINIRTNEGKAGNLTVIASESLELSGNGDELGFGLFATSIFNNVFGDATGEGSSITINTPELTITNGGAITATNLGTAQGVDINVEASEIIVDGSYEFNENFASVITAQVGSDAMGNAGDLTINTETLTVNEGGQITTDTFGAGNAGDLIVNATESIELTGTIPGNLIIASALTARVGRVVTATGNGGNLTITTPTLTVRDGAQITTVAQNEGNAGDLTINVEESILLTGTSPLAELIGEGRGITQGKSGIFVNVQPAFTDPETGAEIPTTGNAGNLNITTVDLTVEKGATIAAGTNSVGKGGTATINVNTLIVSEGGEIGAASRLGTELGTERGTGGNLTITANESVEVTGTGDINGVPVNSSIFTLTESNGDAGNLTLTTGKLTVSDGATIDASTTGSGSAGSINITSNSIALNDGSITASTNAGDQGNINIDIDKNLTLASNSLISAKAASDANGGNVTINAQFIIASVSQPPGNGNDIVADAVEGTGGNINITAEALFGIAERTAIDGNGTNDIDASSDFGLDGNVSINNPDTSHTLTDIDLPNSPIESEQTVAQACPSTGVAGKTNLNIKGKGGLPSQPIDPLDADNILENETITNSNLQSYYPELQPIKTSIGDIYPARGVIKTVDGKIILTSYPTDNLNTRTPHNSANCNSL